MPDISILIPVYNFSIEKLIDDLINQLQQFGIGFEIRVYDDDSLPFFKDKNKSIASKSNVYYRELAQNLGRSKIRNLLAKEALYDYILFLDCDCEIPERKFIENYMNFLPENNITAINGGRRYKPFDCYLPENYLHWWVGSNREVKTALIRNQNKYASFMLDNLLIRKAVFIDILLDENIKTYGHEDTKFGFELEKRNISIIHIDNETFHIGLSNADDFIEKTKLAVKVLAKMIASEGIGKNTSIYKAYNSLQNFHLHKFTSFVLGLFRKTIVRNLKSKKPSLIIFDLYKLNILIESLACIKN